MGNHEELEAKKLERINEVHKMNPDRTALIVTDMQRSFMDPEASLAVENAWDLVPKIKKMINFCRENSITVIFTEYVAEPKKIPCMRVDPFGPEHLRVEEGQETGWGRPSSNSVIGTTGPEDPNTIEELKPRPDELVVRGYTYDKFYGTPLDLALRSQDIRYLMFTGMMADICLGATLFSAATRDYRVTALTDCITTIWPDVLDVMFDIFGRKFARMMESDEAIEELKEQLDK